MQASVYLTEEHMLRKTKPGRRTDAEPLASATLAMARQCAVGQRIVHLVDHEREPSPGRCNSDDFAATRSSTRDSVKPACSDSLCRGSPCP